MFLPKFLTYCDKNRQFYVLEKYGLSIEGRLRCEYWYWEHRSSAVPFYAAQEDISICVWKVPGVISLLQHTFRTSSWPLDQEGRPPTGSTEPAPSFFFHVSHSTAAMCLTKRLLAGLMMRSKWMPTAAGSKISRCHSTENLQLNIAKALLRAFMQN